MVVGSDLTSCRFGGLWLTRQLPPEVLGTDKVELVELGGMADPLWGVEGADCGCVGGDEKDGLGRKSPPPSQLDAEEKSTTPFGGDKLWAGDTFWNQEKRRVITFRNFFQQPLLW